MSGLISVTDWGEVLLSTDAVTQRIVNFDGSQAVTFTLPPGWNVGLGGKDPYDVTEATVTLDGETLNLTRAAITRIAIEIGLPARYIEKTPGPLVEGHLNYWAKHGSSEKPFGLLINFPASVAIAVVKKALTVFPNFDIFSKVADTLASEVWVDQSKSHNAYDLTVTRMVLPEVRRTFVSARTPGEEWWAGVQVVNSLTGRWVTGLEGYIYSRHGEHGVITTHAAQHYNRRGGHSLSDVIDWIPDAVNRVLDAMTYELETVETLVSEPVNAMDKVLADVFRTYKVPLKVRNSIIDRMDKAEDNSYFAIMCAISETANDPDWNDPTVTALMQIAGTVAHDSLHRCPQCQQITL